jgi:succinate dehydrogenase/fumarate reductase flavoprotein subunit
MAAARSRVEEPLARTAGVTAYELRHEIQDVAAAKVGVLRTGTALREAVERLDGLCGDALLREESRGAHYRRDFPQTDNARWLRNTVTRQQGDELHVTTAPVRITSLRPEAAP